MTSVELMVLLGNLISIFGLVYPISANLTIVKGSYYEQNMFYPNHYFFK